MSYKPVDEKTVGLYLKDGRVQAAFVVSAKGILKVERLIEAPLVESSEDLVKPLYTAKEEKELTELAHSHLTVATLGGADVLVRRLRLKLTKEKDIEEAFLFQTEPQLPYPIENAIVDKIIVEKGEGATLIVFLATKKEYLQKLLDFWQSKGIDPEIVSAEPLALNALITTSASPAPLQFVVHIGKESTLFVLIKEGKLLASHTLATGWGSLNAALSQDQGPKPEEIFSPAFDALKSDEPHLKKAVDELLQMMLWNYLSLIKETKVKETPFLYVVGEGANIPHLSSLIETALGISQGELSSFSETRENFNRFALPIGLALTGQPKELPLAINFRKQEFSYATPWKRFKKPLLLYAALALGVAGSLYFFGTNYLKYKEDHLRANFLNLLSFAERPYDKFESLYEQKFPYEKRGESIASIAELDSKAISNRLDFLEKEIKSVPDTFPLLPNIPKVSDVLVWLSTHPTLVCKEGTAECPPFSIDTFNYTLVKRPEITKKNERYQVKIDLEFSTSSPRLAREFHDALITPNDFVDPKGEIKWTATKGKYRTSFYLKDKTVYP